eukprot:5528517-Pyramimonas_sp.AAC.1
MICRSAASAFRWIRHNGINIKKRVGENDLEKLQQAQLGLATVPVDLGGITLLCSTSPYFTRPVCPTL